MFFKSTQKGKKSNRGFKATTGSKDFSVRRTSTGSGHVNRKQRNGKRLNFRLTYVALKRLCLSSLLLTQTWHLNLTDQNYNSALKLFFSLTGQFLFCFVASSPSRSSSRSKSRPIWLEDETGKWTVVSLRKQIIVRCKCFFLFIGREPTTWPANNCLQIIVCWCAMPFNCFWPKIFLKKQSRWSNDKTIIELGCRKISWFVSGEQINYLPQRSASANNRSARHWQITIFFSTSSNNC